jgi:predicted AAA+ superfamily ATPase
MIKRNLAKVALGLAGRYPVLTVTGPRQSGKTTLCRMTFPDKAYVSLEAPDLRRFALTDPRGFLSQYVNGAVLDEVQRAPELLSYIQTLVDEDPAPGRFVLTGSQNFALLSSISQTLAGRTALLNLFPLTLDEIRRFPSPPAGLFPSLWTGGYPVIYDRSLPAGEWLADYVTLYVERDVRQTLKVGDLLAFETFLRLCAGRAAQLLNLSSLAADGGITHGTARSWISVLEVGFLVFRLPPYFTNVGKRLVKAPKLYFFDTGLLCNLLGIQDAAQLVTHPLRGAIFENWVVSEVYRSIAHAGRRPALHFFRDRRGLEVDLLIEKGRDLSAVEIRSAQTVSTDFTTGLTRFSEIVEQDARIGRVRRLVVYGGDRQETRREARILPWDQAGSLAV